MKYLLVDRFLGCDSFLVYSPDPSPVLTGDPMRAWAFDTETEAMRHAGRLNARHWTFQVVPR